MAPVKDCQEWPGKGRNLLFKPDHLGFLQGKGLDLEGWVCLEKKNGSSQGGKGRN